MDSGRSRGELRASLAALSGLVMEQLQLTGLVARVAELALTAIPAAEGAGLVLVGPGGGDRATAAHGFATADGFVEFAGQVVAAERSLADGPAAVALAERRTVSSGALSADRRWPRFAGRVGRLGVHSVLSLPLITADVTVGALNVYARRHDAFDKRDASTGELFAVPAAVAVHNAQALDRAHRLVVELQAALTNRATIDRAVGIVMSHTGCAADEAFARLRRISQRENVKVSAVAKTIVDDAVRRARARRPAADPGLGANA